MRNHTKLKILELLDTVNEALRYIKTTENKDAKNMLHQCCLCMEAICKALAHSGDNNGLIKDELKRFNQKLLFAQKRTDQPNEFRQVLSNIQEKLVFILHKVKKIQTQQEVVFVPYKAAMWDSFESIWRAADADPLCDAYVMPIPHCDLNPNRTPAHIYDESHLFPAEVPITDYRTYDLAEHHPDVIYFHNPYDGHNRITSVLPHFYSDKLKQYTDLLVYVPYFVSVDTIGEQLCRTSGSYNADLIIAPSEKIKEAYLKYHAPEKIAVLGAPQFDAVRWAHEHRPPRPKAWQEIAKGRKLILYNTHLSPLFIDNGSVCRKLRYVFSCFKGRDDVCLLWRPHPLSIATMKAMNPRPLQEYLDLVKSFKESKLGIYDDSADVHRAIELSVAYYGDYSSLVDMYGVTGKPIMMQNMRMCSKATTEEEKGYLAFWDVVIEDNTAWFAACHFNGLFKMDLTTGQVSFVGEFPGEMGRNMLYSKVLEVGRKLFFIPWQAKSIAAFDRDTAEFKTYELPAATSATLVKSRTAFLCGEWICSIPLGCQFAFRFNVRSGELKIYDNWYEKLLPLLHGDILSLFRDAVQVGDFAWCPCSQGNIIVRFNLRNMKADFFAVGTQKNGFYSITFDGRDFWLLSGEGEIVRWNPQSSKIRINDTFSKKIKGENQAWTFCRYGPGILYIFAESGEIITLDIATGQMSGYQEYPSNFKRDGESGWTLKNTAPEVQDGVLSVFSFEQNAWLQIDAKTGESRSWKIRLTPDEEKKLNHPYALFNNENMGKDNLILYGCGESNILTLSSYLNYIAGDQYYIDKSQSMNFRAFAVHADGSCGAQIHQSTREALRQSAQGIVEENGNGSRQRNIL